MPNVLVNDDSLKAIGNAIREKNGETTTYKPAEMADAIIAISGGEDSPTDKELTFSGECSYLNYYGKFDWIFRKYGNRITINNATSLKGAFTNSSLEKIPNVTIDFTDKYNIGDFTLFCFNMTKMKELPILNGNITNPKTKFSFSIAQNFINKNVDYSNIIVPWDYITRLMVNCATDNTADLAFNEGGVFSNTYLSNHWDISYLKVKGKTPSSVYYTPYYSTFLSAYYMEIIKLPIFNYQDAITFNMFSETFGTNNKLHSLIFFKIDDVINTAWKNQVINLTKYIGYNTVEGAKNSRYNRNSAVETINSLPDTSAYLATAGGTNTIKFTGEAGSATDGGAINTMTEEEIAVATAKGWTVSFT